MGFVVCNTYYCYTESVIRCHCSLRSGSTNEVRKDYEPIAGRGDWSSLAWRVHLVPSGDHDTADPNRVSGLTGTLGKVSPKPSQQVTTDTFATQNHAHDPCVLLSRAFPFGRSDQLGRTRRTKHQAD